MRAPVSLCARISPPGHFFVLCFVLFPPCTNAMIDICPAAQAEEASSWTRTGHQDGEAGDEAGHVAPGGRMGHLHVCKHKSTWARQGLLNAGTLCKHQRRS